jgi:hypothetical protein
MHIIASILRNGKTMGNYSPLSKSVICLIASSLVILSISFSEMSMHLSSANLFRSKMLNEKLID